MAKKSPNKRKSVTNSPAGETTPKKLKQTEAPKPTPAKTPKSEKKAKKAVTPSVVPAAENGTSKKGKMPKFSGTKDLGEEKSKPNMGFLNDIPEEKLKTMSRRQKKRLIDKMRKKAKVEAMIASGVDPASIAKKTVKEMTQSDKKNKKNKKQQNIIAKVIADVKPEGKSKKQKKNKAEKKPEEVELPKSDEEDEDDEDDDDDDGSEDGSDYEVETEIIPAKIAKTMNDTNDSDENDDEDEQDDDEDEQNDDDDDDKDDEEETTEPPKKQKIQQKPAVAADDLKKSGLINKGQSRYVLHINNIPYETTKEQIQQHFAKACELKDVRIPTDKNTKKPKGFGYIEVANETDYQVKEREESNFLTSLCYPNIVLDLYLGVKQDEN